MTPINRKEITSLLRRYFYSGWAFLIPYLAIYLLYYVTKWPVNPVGLGVGSQETEMSAANAAHPWVPCMLHVYWFLHAVHVFCAGFALWSWIKEYKSQTPSSKLQSESNSPSNTQELAATHQPASSPSGLPTTSYQLLAPNSCCSPLIRLAPWVLLALIFYIPGVYLEWPSDPWEHLRRINEWHVLDTVGAHSYWHKSAYFIPYSLLSWCIGLRQLYWLDYYYTGICLLLCWQYYRFSRACGLSDRASMVFVIIQALLFGNNIFSFYRYYGISSSIYAQIGAIALTRITLEFASRKPFWDGPVFALRFPLRTVRSLLFPVFSHPSILFAVPCLLAFTAFNHAQGLGIAAIGMMAIFVWRFATWKSYTLWWLVGCGIVINAHFLFFQPHSAAIEACRAQGFLSPWYGINILDLTSIAGDRMLQVAGCVGLIGAVAAIYLLRGNHVVGWLTITPFLTLLSPAFGIPFANLNIMRTDIVDIITFQRMLFSIPCGISIILLVSVWSQKCSRERTLDSCATLSKHHKNFSATLKAPRGVLATGTVTISIAFFLSSTGSHPVYNRIFNTILVPPDDLRGRIILSNHDFVRALTSERRNSPLISTSVGEQVFSACAPSAIFASSSRIIGQAAVPATIATLDRIGVEAKAPSHKEDCFVHAKDTKLSQASRALDSGWISLAGPKPEILPGLPRILQNPVGATCYAFTSDLIPIHRGMRYLLRMTVRQAQGTNGTAYLAVAWYNAEAKVLESNINRPLGAGNPRGWTNGTYSYFGLLGQSPTQRWKEYGISFGLGEPLSIPTNARFMRVGALLNYIGDQASIIQLMGVGLSETPSTMIPCVLPRPTSVFSPASQSAQLSSHWPPQQVIVDSGGTSELLTAVKPIAESAKTP